MSDENGLPAGWTMARVDSLVQLVNGFAFKPTQWTTEGMPIIRIQNLNNSDAPFNYCSEELPDKYRVRHGDLLFAWSGTPGTSFGAHIWHGEDAWLNQHIFKVIFDREQVDPHFLQLTINQNLDSYIRQAHGGAGLAHITKGRFEASRLRIAPHNEQQRIVAKIEELFSDLDAGVAALERARANLKRYRAAVLKAAVTGMLTERWRAEHPDVEPASALLQRILAERRQCWELEQLAKFADAGKQPRKNWREKYKEPALVETTELPSLPALWAWATVEQLSTKVVDGVHKKPAYVDEGIPFVTVRNLTSGPGISFDRLNYITPSDHETFTKRANPQAGDILITKDGTLGVTRAVRTSEPFSIFVSLALVKPVDRGATEYLETAFSSPVVQRQMVGKGSGLQHIHLEDLRKDCIPLPPRLEQQEIASNVAEKLSQIDAAEAEIAQSLRRAARLRQSILKAAFNGNWGAQDATQNR
ncbi:MAG: restriction endonuclease subunit S [Planctomycetales bacterium]